MTREPARIVLVTGASKGIGAEVARQLAGADTHVIVNHRGDAERASGVAAAIRDAGGAATIMPADNAAESDAAAMAEAIAARFGRLDALVLTASSRVGAGSDLGLAMRLNRDANRRLAALALPLMPAGARIVYATNHQAHFFPHKAVPKGYTAAAASQRAGETALYAMRPAFDRAGIHFSVVSADLVDGATVSGLVQPRNVEGIAEGGEGGEGGEGKAAHRDRVHRAAFTAAIVHAATTAHPASVVYTGGDHLLSA